MRDGVPYPPANIGELEILPGVIEALEKLHTACQLLIVVTNQPDLARGITAKADIEQINAELFSRLRLDDIKTCYHDSGDGCLCRKNLPGALLAASKEYYIDLSQSFIVGDHWRDIEAGQSAGCKTFLLIMDIKKSSLSADFIVSSLAKAAEIIIGELN